MRASASSGVHGLLGASACELGAGVAQETSAAFAFFVFIALRSASGRSSSESESSSTAATIVANAVTNSKTNASSSVNVK